MATMTTKTTTQLVEKKSVRGKLRDTARHFRIIEQCAALVLPPLVSPPPRLYDL